jgi:hypothetical protein
LLSSQGGVVGKASSDDNKKAWSALFVLVLDIRGSVEQIAADFRVFCLPLFFSECF